MKINLNTESSSDEVLKLSQKFLRKRLYVMLRTPSQINLAQSLFTEHLRWVIDSENQGKIFASGPFVAKGSMPGKPGSPAGGMTLIRAISFDEAKEIADTDPYIVNDVVKYELKEWLLMEGSFSLKISFSQGTYSFD
jgi:uncharacterized protein YciI